MFDSPRHIVINGWFLGQQTTGSGQYLHHLLRYLPRLAPQYRFTVLVPAPRPALTSSEHFGPSIQIIDTDLPFPIPHPQLAKLWFEQITIPRWATQWQADLLWVPYWAAPLWQPVPTVATVHDLIQVLLPEYRGGLLQQLYFKLVGYTARKARQIIAVSEAGKQDIVQHLRIEPDRVFAVLHGPNQEGDVAQVATGATPREEGLRAKYGLPDRYFLYLGGFDARKNVTTTLHAYKRYLEQGGDAGVKLVIAGELPGAHTDFAPDPRHLAADLGLLDHVVFAGWVEEEDKPGIYALSTAYLFPSLYEGFGMMVLEAMQAGTPVITSAK